MEMSVYGFADAAAAFDKRHPDFLKVMERLGKAIDLAFTRTQIMDTAIEKFVYFYGGLISEDFMEIFLMAANGYGYGAMKLLRPMYEHTITLQYLDKHPDELQNFFDFDKVQQYKLMRPILDTFGPDALPADLINETERNYSEVRDSFMVKSCKAKDCAERRLGYTWSKLDFVSMAKQGGDIGKLIVPGYFVPLRHSHSTYRAMVERLEKLGDGIEFNRESQPREADEALMTAHNCLLVALGVQEERFKIEGLKQAISDSVLDWALIWAPDSLSRLKAMIDRP